MVDPIERPKFIRVEGFFDKKAAKALRKAVGKIATDSSATIEVQPLRDRNKYGELFSELPRVGLVITKSVLVQFSRTIDFGVNRRLSDGGTKMQGRAATLFGALHHHVMFAHHKPAADATPCECCLRGGTETYPRGSFGFDSHIDYIEPISLVNAYESGEIDEIRSVSATFTKTEPKLLKDSACYSILPPYIEAISK
jgi:hypothetical protein